MSSEELEIESFINECIRKIKLNNGSDLNENLPHLLQRYVLKKEQEELKKKNPHGGKILGELVNLGSFKTLEKPAIRYPQYTTFFEKGISSNRLDLNSAVVTGPGPSEAERLVQNFNNANFQDEALRMMMKTMV